MWTLIGPFDGSDVGELNFEKVKLVKPGKEYVVGRKDCPLMINHKRVSRKHLVFSVGGYSEEDVENPDAVPSLNVHSLVSNRAVHRGGTELSVNAGSTMTLRDGDKLEVVHSVEITIKWEKVVCFYPPSREMASLKTQECSELGLSVVLKLHPSVTHHITSELTLDPAIATSLLGLAKFVKPDWLDTVIRCGVSSDPSTSLESVYTLPSPSQYRPVLSAFLPSSLKNYRSWEPNEDRVDFLKAFRVIFVGERGREVLEEYKELVRRGAATYECCAVQGGRKLLHSVLAKGQDKSTELILIADHEAMIAAVGKDEWAEMVQEAAEYGLQLIPPLRLVEAVAHVDLSHVDCKLERAEVSTGSALPDVVLNTHPSEPTVPPVEVMPMPRESAPRKQLLRRAASRASSRASSPAVQAETAGVSVVLTTDLPPIAEAGPAGEEGAKPRKRLTRRAGIAKPIILGVDDPSVVEDGPIDLTTAHAAPEPTTMRPPPPSASRPNRLKRRYGLTQPPESQLFAAIDASLAESEPPHKKYRALFDESDPDKIPKSSIGYNIESGSMTQPETPLASNAPTQDFPRRASSLIAEAEEAEESACLSPSGSLTAVSAERPQGVMRNPMADNNGDVDMTGAGEDRMPPKRGIAIPTSGRMQNADGSAQPYRKPVSSKVFDSTQANTAPSQKSGAAPGRPDKDEAFLKAVASTKRGKKQEDPFDREFNNLRISKPDLKHEQVADDWDVLADFGDDTDLRGNFMVVVEMDIFRKDDTEQRPMRTAGSRLDWEGRPDFKKFKKKSAGERPKPVELFFEDEDGYGLTHESWSGPSQLQIGKSTKQKTKASLQMNRPELIVDSDDDTPKPAAKSKRPTSRVQTESTVPKRKAGPSSRHDAQPLFLDSDEEGNLGDGSRRSRERAISSEAGADGTSAATELIERRAQAPKPTTRKRPVTTLIMDDSSDDEGFIGFGARKKVKR